jgi:hypothetical protein
MSNYGLFIYADDGTLNYNSITDTTNFLTGYQTVLGSSGGHTLSGHRAGDTYFAFDAGGSGVVATKSGAAMYYSITSPGYVNNSGVFRPLSKTLVPGSCWQPDCSTSSVGTFVNSVAINTSNTIVEKFNTSNVSSQTHGMSFSNGVGGTVFLEGTTFWQLKEKVGGGYRRSAVVKTFAGKSGGTYSVEDAAHNSSHLDTILFDSAVSKPPLILILKTHCAINKGVSFAGFVKNAEGLYSGFKLVANLGWNTYALGGYWAEDSFTVEYAYAVEADNDGEYGVEFNGAKIALTSPAIKLNTTILTDRPYLKTVWNSPTTGAVNFHSIQTTAWDIPVNAGVCINAMSPYTGVIGSTTVNWDGTLIGPISVTGTYVYVNEDSIGPFVQFNPGATSTVLTSHLVPFNGATLDLTGSLTDKIVVPYTIVP